MDDATAGRAIDWLHSVGCRVVGLMGGEPLIRPDFVCRFARYAAGKGLYVYLPTNGRLLDGVPARWRCRAGENMVVIRTDGTLAPCYPLRGLEHDWGAVGSPHLLTPVLAGIKQKCSESCFSTVAYTLANCYHTRRVFAEIWEQSVRRRRGAREIPPQPVGKDPSVPIPAAATSYNGGWPRVRLP